MVRLSSLDDSRNYDSKSKIYPMLAVQFHLSWSHYIELLTIDDDKERRFYEIEAKENSWSLRELKRQLNSSLYQRLALSRNKDEICQLAEQGLVIEKAADIIKNPLVLEFLGIQEKASYSEEDLEVDLREFERINQQADEGEEWLHIFFDLGETLDKFNSNMKSRSWGVFNYQ